MPSTEAAGAGAALLRGIVLGCGARPGLSLHFGAGAEKEKEDKALFSNCPLQRFCVDRVDFFALSSLTMSERGSQVMTLFLIIRKIGIGLWRGFQMIFNS